MQFSFSQNAFISRPLNHKLVCQIYSFFSFLQSTCFLSKSTQLHLITLHLHGLCRSIRYMFQQLRQQLFQDRHLTSMKKKNSNISVLLEIEVFLLCCCSFIQFYFYRIPPLYVFLGISTIFTGFVFHCIQWQKQKGVVHMFLSVRPFICCLFVRFKANHAFWFQVIYKVPITRIL